MAGASSPAPCIFCQISGKSTSTNLLHTDDTVVAFQDVRPSAFRWKHIKYLSLGPLGFIEAERLLEKIKP
ncbi:Bifunctional adenosine 5'-phosphosulfate phosphorylase/adenylylsulfatase HINT4 [Linum perenne]